MPSLLYLIASQIDRYGKVMTISLEVDGVSIWATDTTAVSRTSLSSNTENQSMDFLTRFSTVVSKLKQLGLL